MSGKVNEVHLNLREDQYDDDPEAKEHIQMTSIKTNVVGTIKEPDGNALLERQTSSEVVVVEKPRVSQGLCQPLDNLLTLLEVFGAKVYSKNKETFKIFAVAVLCGGFVAYFLVACFLDFKRAIDLFGITMFALACILYWLFKRICGDKVYTYCGEPIKAFVSSHRVIFKWFSLGIFMILIILWLALDTAQNPKRLISLVGLLIYILLGYVFSRHRSQVNWRPVIWGFGLQFVFGLLILRTRPGFLVFDWLGERAKIFLEFSDAGAEFLFDPNNYTQHYFAFKVLPVVVFFSAFIYMVYYLGAMEIVIKKIAWLMQAAMGVSAAESLNAAGNIFIGQTESPLLIRPFLADMTLSELHAVMTGGFATIAGSVLGAFIGFGVSPSHLLSASVMSAPAALAMSKLMYPEVQKPKTQRIEDIKLEKGKEKNALEALAAGASMSIPLVANIAVMLIAFLSVLRFINALLAWTGSLVGYSGLSFERICSYVLMPFAYIMGVEWDDAFVVAELLGTKTFLNEFVAYGELGKYIKRRRNNLPGKILSLRSEVIATYACCGFSNLGSLGAQIGGIGGIVPSRRSDLAMIGVRALVAGSFACFMTACIAGRVQMFQNPLVLPCRYRRKHVVLNGLIKLRAETIATYSLCGFANIGSVGVQIGGIGAIAPDRRSDLANIAFRSLAAGTMACFMTACIAGILYKEGYDDSIVAMVNATSVPTVVTSMLTTVASKP